MSHYYNSIHPSQLAGSDLDKLLALGWYRIQQTIFTSSHVGLEDVHRVHWLRYSVHEINDRSSHRRIRRRNKDFQFIIEDFKSVQTTHAELHSRYYAHIDFDGALSIEECLFGEETTAGNIYNTKCISVFDNDKLIAGAYFDVGQFAAASILHFFDPRYKRNSLGKYLILLTIDYLKSNNYKFYYPGYVVEGNDKMNYKLFLGKKEAQYFDPETTSWRYFNEDILVKKSPNVSPDNAISDDNALH